MKDIAGRFEAAALLLRVLERGGELLLREAGLFARCGDLELDVPGFARALEAFREAGIAELLGELAIEIGLFHLPDLEPRRLKATEERLRRMNLRPIFVPLCLCGEFCHAFVRSIQARTWAPERSKVGNRLRRRRVRRKRLPVSDMAYNAYEAEWLSASDRPYKVGRSKTAVGERQALQGWRGRAAVGKRQALHGGRSGAAAGERKPYRAERRSARSGDCRRKRRRGFTGPPPVRTATTR